MLKDNVEFTIFEGSPYIVSPPSFELFEEILKEYYNFSDTQDDREFGEISQWYEQEMSEYGTVVVAKRTFTHYPNHESNKEESRTPYIPTDKGKFFAWSLYPICESVKNCVKEILDV